jgi:DNA-binding NarL/FixJ family response regulator
MAATLQADVILMDLVMPEMDGVTAIGQIRQQNPVARILVLTSFGEREQVVAAVQAGALGYLLKDSSPDDLFDAIRSVHRGNLHIPQALAQELMQPLPAAARSEAFTARELEVLRLLAQGKSNREIGEALYISATTVRSHVSNLLLKLDVDNRTQAAMAAQEQGLL